MIGVKSASGSYCRFGISVGFMTCVFVAMSSVVLICTLNLLTQDTSAAAQDFFAFPVFWAASHLRASGVALVTAMAVSADTATLFLLLPPSAAATDAVFFGAVLVVMAVMLVRANATQEGGAIPVYSQVMAAALVTAAPVVILYLVFQRYLVGGLTAGGVK